MGGRNSRHSIGPLCKLEAPDGTSHRAAQRIQAAAAAGGSHKNALHYVNFPRHPTAQRADRRLTLRDSIVIIVKIQRRRQVLLTVCEDENHIRQDLVVERILV